MQTQLHSNERGSHSRLSRWALLLNGVMLLGVCALAAIPRGYYSNFMAINGTFQNYNPCRRLLAGQVPGVDFTDYLGMGHLYSGSLVTGLLGGSYNDSLHAFAFLSTLSLCLIILVLSVCIIQNKLTAFSITAFTSISLFCIHCNLFPTLSQLAAPIMPPFKTAFWVGNSARFVRGLILPLLMLMVLGGYALYRRVLTDKGTFPRGALLVLISGAGGFCFLWSNDYGLGCWVCLLIMTFWVVLSRTRRITKAIFTALVTLAGSLVWALLGGTLATRGHIFLWMKEFFSTDRYQSWYYISAKSFHLYDIEMAGPILLQALIAVVYLILVFVHRGSARSILRFGIPGFMNLCCYAAVNEYKLLSGGKSWEVALVVLYITCSLELLRLLGAAVRWALHARPAAKRALACGGTVGIICVTCVIFGYVTNQIYIKGGLHPPAEGKSSIYMKELDGYVATCGESLRATHQFLNGDKIWATYASAQEVIEGTYQPSRYDYIIHVLSDAAREEYLSTFHTAEFRYVSTINKSYSTWQYWIERANWFFFRELYQDWHPVHYNEYATYWERNATGPSVLHTPVTLEATVNELGQTVITATADPSVNGIADVWIDYEVVPDEDHSPLLFNPMLYVQSCASPDTWFDERLRNTYLRAQSAEYIPILLENGHGQINLYPLPNNETSLRLNAVECDTVYPTPASYIGCQSITHTEDTLIFHVQNNTIHQRNLQGATQVEFRGTDFAIQEITSNEEVISIAVAADDFSVPEDDLKASENILHVF